MDWPGCAGILLYVVTSQMYPYCTSAISQCTGQLRQIFNYLHLRETQCNSMPFGAAWAYYGKVLVVASAALWNSCVRSEVK